MSSRPPLPPSGPARSEERLASAVRAWWSFWSDWRKLVAVALAGTAGGYLILVTLVHWHWESRPGNEVSWTDLALAPITWENFRTKRGDSAIARGILALERGDFSEGYFEISYGVPLSPGNIRGRSLLVEMIGQWDPDRADRLLAEGEILHPGNSELVAAAISFHEKQRAPEKTLALTERLLAPPLRATLSADSLRLLVNARASTLLSLERPQEALAALADRSTESEPDQGNYLRLLRARALSQLKRHEEARAELAALGPNSTEALYLEAELALAAADDERLHTAILRLKVAAPDSIEPMLTAYRAWHLRNRLTRRDAVETEIRENFAADTASLQRFGRLLVELDLPEPLKRLQNHAVENGHNSFAFQAQQTDLALRRGDFDRAFRSLQDWEWVISNVKTQQRGYPEFLRRLVRATIDGGAANSGLLVGHLASLRGQAMPEHFVFAAQTLERADKLQAAADVTVLGTRFFPFSLPLGDLRRRLESTLAQEQRAQRDRDNALKAEVNTRVANAEAILEEINQSLDNGSFVSARLRLQELREVRPTWAQERESEIDFLRLKLSVFTEEGTDLRNVVRVHLTHHRTAAEALHLLSFAKQLMEQRRDLLARLLQSEVAQACGAMPEVSAALAELNGDERWLPVAQSQEKVLQLLDRELARNDPDAVIAQIAQVRQARPAWLDDESGALEAREFRARWALGQKPAALIIFRNLVLKSGARRALAFRIVRDFVTEGDRPSALTLAKEINVLLPDDRTAVRLQREVEAPVRPPAS